MAQAVHRTAEDAAQLLTRKDAIVMSSSWLFPGGWGGERIAPIGLEANHLPALSPTASSPATRLGGITSVMTSFRVAQAVHTRHALKRALPGLPQAHPPGGDPPA